MCGSDGNIRIEPAENGMTIDAYTPGKDGPGQHRRLVAANADHALRLLKPHLAKIGKKAGRGRGKGRGGHVELVGDGPAPAKGRKRTARKKA